MAHKVIDFFLNKKCVTDRRNCKKTAELVKKQKKELFKRTYQTSIVVK